MEGDGITPLILKPLQYFKSRSVSRSIRFAHWIGGLQSLSVCYGEQNDILPLPGIEPRLLWSSVRNLDTVPTELFQLCCRHHRLQNGERFRTTCEGERELDVVSRRNESLAELGCAFYGIFKSTWKGVTLGHSAERKGIRVRRIPSTDKPFIWLAITWLLPEYSTPFMWWRGVSSDNTSRHNDTDWMSSLLSQGRYLSTPQ
jgi:hypothetical protein